ncbi:hypothetical protein VPH35_052590 [Triticum aestivum]
MPMPLVPTTDHHNAGRFVVGRGNGRNQPRRRSGLRFHHARGGAHVEGAVVHLPEAGIPVPERPEVRPGLQPFQLVRLARSRARRDRRADGHHHGRRGHLPQGTPRVAASALGLRVQRRQRAQPPTPLLAPPTFIGRRARRRPRDARRR